MWAASTRSPDMGWGVRAGPRTDLLNRTRGADQHLPTRSPRRRPPGRSTGPCPRQRGPTSASSASTWTANSAPAGTPAASATSRQTRARTASGSAASATASSGPSPRASRASPASRSSRSASVAQQVGRAGEGGGRRPARGHVRAPTSRRRARTRAVGRVVVVRVLPRVEPRRPARRLGGGPGQVQQRARERVAPARHPGQRPGPGAAGEAQQHRLGLVVAGVPEQHQPGAEPRRGVPQRVVARGAGGGLGALPRRTHGHAQHVDRVQPEVGAAGRRLGGDVGGVGPAARGRRRAPRPAARPGAPRTRWPPPAPASRRRRCTRPGPAPRRAKAASAARTATRVAATAGWGPVSRGRAAPTPRAARSPPAAAASPGRSRRR